MVPIFAFRLGDWHWNAPFTLGAEAPSRRAELAAALAAGELSNYEGWSIDFHLVDALTQTTTARRKVPAPTTYSAEVASHLLRTEMSDLFHQINAVQTLYERVPTNAALFRRAKRRHMLT